MLQYNVKVPIWLKKMCTWYTLEFPILIIFCCFILFVLDVKRVFSVGKRSQPCETWHQGFHRFFAKIKDTISEQHLEEIRKFLKWNVIAFGKVIIPIPVTSMVAVYLYKGGFPVLVRSSSQRAASDACAHSSNHNAKQFILIRCKHSQRVARSFVRGLETALLLTEHASNLLSCAQSVVEKRSRKA
jgi:hypothetical protein